MDRQYKVLIAEDDPDIVEVLKLYLENAGFAVITAGDGAAAWQLLTECKPDIGLFDIMMPQMSGYELIRKVRADKNSLPVIFISAKREDSEKIIGLDMGADDYLTKPFNPLEVVSRVKANLRRYYELGASKEAASIPASELAAGDLRVDLRTLQLYKNGREVNVTPTELKILILLMRSPGRVFTKVQIYEQINGEYFENDENTIMVHVSNLRDKIEDDSKKPMYLQTVRGLGYRFCGDIVKGE